MGDEQKFRPVEGTKPKSSNDIVIERFDSSPKKSPAVESIQAAETVKEMHDALIANIRGVREKHALGEGDAIGEIRKVQNDELKNELTAEVNKLSKLLGTVLDESKQSLAENMDANSTGIREACDVIISYTARISEVDLKESLRIRLDKEEKEIEICAKKYHELEEKENTGAVSGPGIQENRSEMFKFKNSLRMTIGNLNKLEKDSEMAFEILEERKNSPEHQELESLAFSNWVKEKKTTLPDFGAYILSLNRNDSILSHFKDRMSVYTDVSYTEVGAREILHICNKICDEIAEKKAKGERERKAQEEKEAALKASMAQQEARLATMRANPSNPYPVPGAMPQIGKDGKIIKRKKPVAESITLLGGGIAFYGLATSMPYVALSGLAASLIGFDAYKSRHSWRQTGDFCAKAIGRVGTTAGLASVVSGGSAYLIQEAGAIELLFAAKFNGLYVIASHIVDYVKVVGDPLKLLIGGAVCTVASLTASWIIRRVTDNIDE